MDPQIWIRKTKKYLWMRNTAMEGLRYGSGTPVVGTISRGVCAMVEVWCGMPGGQEATIWSDMYHEPKD